MIWFGWVGYLMPNPLYTYIYYIYNLLCFGFMAHNHCRLFKAKSFIYVYIEYIWFGLVWFYGISAIKNYLMPDHLYTYISYIWFVSLGFYSIPTIVGYLMPNPLYIYLYIYLGLVGFYGISTTVGYSMPNHLHTYTTNHCQVEKIYIGKKKEKANLVIPIEKNQKTRNWLVKRKKTHPSDC